MNGVATWEVEWWTIDGVDSTVWGLGKSKNYGDGTHTYTHLGFLEETITSPE